MGSAHWRPIWRTKSTASVRAASGRSTYSPEQVTALMMDAWKALELDPEDSLLDIGCAAGLLGQHLSEGVKRYVGIDYSLGAVGGFADRCNVATACASATALPFRNGAFTKTLTSSVLLCLSKDEGLTALREMRRVTKDGGIGFVSGNLDAGGYYLCPYPEAFEHATWYTPGELLRMAFEAGWTDVHMQAPNVLIPQAPFHVDMVVRA